MERETHLVAGVERGGLPVLVGYAHPLVLHCRVVEHPARAPLHCPAVRLVLEGIQLTVHLCSRGGGGGGGGRGLMNYS